jgi:hypothetical protein
MKGRRGAFVGIACIAGLIASGAYARDKPDEPDKPGKPSEPTTEYIAFSGDFLGGEAVVGCCPNAGPAPPYELTVARDLGVGNPEHLQVSADTYSGFLFMNRYGAGRNQEYLVRFWGVSDSGNHIAIEIIGGVIDDDRKNKITTVTFEPADCVHLETKEFIDTVSFALVRTRL